jgi:hypothetical protein
MRAGTLSALALGALLTAGTMPAAAQGGMNMQDTSRKVPGGGITASGWKGQVDAGEAGRGGKIEDSKLAQEGDKLVLNNGPAAVYWNPADTASGSYTVSATFTEPKYMSSNDHPHPYGIFIGGNKLGTAQYSLLYCTAYGNGSFIVRGFGPATFAPNNARRPTPNDAIHKAETGGSVTQDIAWVVTPEKAECKINGVVVGSYPKADIVGPGKLDSLDGIAGIRAAHNIDITISNFKISK